MRRYWICTLLPLLAAAGSARGETRRAVFEGAGTEHTWALKDLDPGLPADWSPFQFLVLELRLSLAAALRPAHPRRGRRALGAPGAGARRVDPLRRAAQLSDAGRTPGQRPGFRPQQGAADDVHQPERHARRIESGARDRRRDGEPAGSAVAGDPFGPVEPTRIPATPCWKPSRWWTSSASGWATIGRARRPAWTSCRRPGPPRTKRSGSGDIP